MNENQLQTLLNAINTLQDLGKVAYFNKGNFNSQTEYEINDVVSYNGSSYVSLVNNNRGNLPTNTAFWSVVASKGDKGDTGKAFVIEKTYSTIEDMVDDYDNMEINDYVMIQGDIEEQENATLWVKTDTEVSPYKWVYLADFSGASGITGATPNIQIGTVTEGNQPSVTRRAGSTNENPILDFVLKTGAKGDTGATGNGISSVSKTGTSGLTDIYTIAYTNGGSDTFNVVNGKGIVSIQKTGSVDTVDTYTITYNDGTTSTFEVTNGEVTQAQLDETNEEVERANMVYNALPKVSGEGTDLTLNNTAECPVYDVGLSPSELEQETTSGTQLFNVSAVPSATGLSIDSEGWITITGDNTSGTSSLFINFFTDNLNLNTSTNYNSIVEIKSVSGEGTLNTVSSGSTSQFSNGDARYLNDVSANTTYQITVTTKDNFEGATLGCRGYVVFSAGQSGTIKFRYSLIADTTVTPSTFTYEPYTGEQPSPNPQYPQQIHVVSGENSVKVSNKNSFDKDTVTLSAYLKEDGTLEATSSDVYKTSDFIPIIPNTAYYKTLTGSPRAKFYNKNKQPLNTTTYQDISIGSSAGTFTTPNGAYYLRVTVNTNNANINEVMINAGTNALSYEEHQEQTYPISLGDLEYCKIGNYEDLFMKPSESNLFDKDTITDGKWLKIDGTEESSSNYCISDYIEVSENKQYYLPTIMSKRLKYYNSNKQALTNEWDIANGDSGQAITIPTNAKYVRFSILTTSVDINTFMFNKGSTALPYEPYDNGKWYLKKNIGKVVLDGSENWDIQNTWSSVGDKTNAFYITKPTEIISQQPCYCEYLKYVATSVITSTDEYGISYASNLIIRMPKTITNANALKTYLASNNISVRFCSNTPTYTLLNDTLQTQLDNIQKAISYQDQTNVSQTNADLPFVIKMSAIRDMSGIFELIQE